MRLKQALTNTRVIILLIVLVLLLIALRPNPFSDGVMIKSVARNSSASLGGIENPKPNSPPMSRERVTAVNQQPVHTLADYYKVTKELPANRTIIVATTKSTYKLTTKPKLKITVLNETENITVQEIVQVNETINGTTTLVNKSINKTKEVPKQFVEVIGTEDLGLKVDEAPKTNLRKGLDLQGGTRVVLKPVFDANQTMNQDDALALTMDSLRQRLNVYGVSDIVITEVSDRPAVLGPGNKFILIEIAGATEEDVKQLLGNQGKFEAKIGDDTVFRGGQDVTYVCRTADCSGIDPNRGCRKLEQGYVCGFRFSIALSPSAADKQAAVTNKLTVVTEQGDRFLSEQLSLHLDDQEVDRSRISAELKGKAATEISITGSGTGISQQEAMTNSLQSMRRLQTILVTGSLPIKLEIERIDAISPVLGSAFIKNALLLAVLAVTAVTLVLIIAYRRLRLAIPIILTSLSEVFIVIGFYAAFGWSFDLAAIAGIIVSVGTGVDDQIVIVGEALKGEASNSGSWKDRLKRAFFIIFSGYFTEVVAMAPLLFAGAGLLRGFAITNIVGLTAGVLITRPAFAAIVQWLVE